MRDEPSDRPELHDLLISIWQVLINYLAHGAERGAAIRGECGEVLGHGGEYSLRRTGERDPSRKLKAEQRKLIQVGKL
jgi:hypothetical protein